MRRNRTFDEPVKHSCKLAHTRPTYDSCLHPQHKVTEETTTILDQLSKITRNTEHAFILSFSKMLQKIENNQIQRIRYINQYFFWKFLILRDLKLRFANIQFWYEMERKLLHWSSFAELSCPVGRFAQHQTSKLDIMCAEFPTFLNSILNPVSASFATHNSLLIFNRERWKLLIRLSAELLVIALRKSHVLEFVGVEVTMDICKGARDDVCQSCENFQGISLKSIKLKSLKPWLLVFIEGLNNSRKNNRALDSYCIQANFVKHFLLFYIILYYFILLYIYIHMYI